MFKYKFCGFFKNHEIHKNLVFKVLRYTYGAVDMKNFMVTNNLNKNRMPVQKCEVLISNKNINFDIKEGQESISFFLHRCVTWPFLNNEYIQKGGQVTKPNVVKMTCKNTISLCKIKCFDFLAFLVDIKRFGHL